MLREAAEEIPAERLKAIDTATKQIKQLNPNAFRPEAHQPVGKWS